MRLAVCVDGGASRSSACLIDESGTILGRADAGPLSLNYGGHTVIGLLHGIAHDLIASSAADLPIEGPTLLVAGLAGTEIADEAALLRGHPAPGLDVHLLSDGEISLIGGLGATGDGIVVAAGTGTVCLARIGGEMRRTGGWGFPLSDEGGGAWMGFRAVQETLRHLDHPEQGADDPIYGAVLAALGLADQAGIAIWARDAGAADYAALAPVIVGSGSGGTAARILAEAAAAIATLIHQASPDATPPIVLVGGLAGSVAPHLPDAVRARIRPALGSALDGAVTVALGLLRGTAV